MLALLFYIYYDAKCGSCSSKSKYSGYKIPTSLLKEKGWKLYSMSTCKFCVRQKELLDDPYFAIECGGVCGHKAHPLWVNMDTGEEKYGSQDLEALKIMSGISPNVV